MLSLYEGLCEGKAQYYYLAKNTCKPLDRCLPTIKSSDSFDPGFGSKSLGSMIMGVESTLQELDVITVTCQ